MYIVDFTISKHFRELVRNGISPRSVGGRQEGCYAHVIDEAVGNWGERQGMCPTPHS